MRDPLGPAPAILQKWTEPLTQPPFNLRTLPLHIHEIFGAWAFYTIFSYFVAPALSRALFLTTYPNLSYKTRTNWDVHVTSLFQAILICTGAIYILVNDHELTSGHDDWYGRIFGYSGAAGLLQALACGYFLWDVWISTAYFSVQGPGSLAHAISALFVTAIGFRPFANYYGVVFILYELSTPFLNIHWFLDKLNMTGTKPQLYNGILLIITFGCCRLIWGTYQSYNIYYDLWNVMKDIDQRSLKTSLNDDISSVAKEVYQNDRLPLSLAILYLASNTLLLFLNFYWFRAMIQAVTKRFRKPAEKTK